MAFPQLRSYMTYIMAFQMWDLKKLKKASRLKKKSCVLFSRNALPFFGFLTVEWEEREERKAEVSLLPGMRPLS